MTSKISLHQSAFLIWSQEHTQGSCTLCINVLPAETMLNSRFILQALFVRN